MLAVIIAVRELSENWNIRPTGILHVGAHMGEEVQPYEENGWLPIVWIDAQPQLCTKLKEKLDPENHQVICAAIWDVSGVNLEFNISSNSQSSSFLEFGTHAENYPKNTVVEKYSLKTSTLSELKTHFHNLNFLNLDIQGVELQALKGLSEKISSISWIYTEVNREEVYVGCAKIDVLDEFLESKGFTRIATRWCLGVGWGDALYVRKVGGYTFRQKINQLRSFLKWYVSEVLRFPIRVARRNIRSKLIKRSYG